jgi:hypothetical protein
MKKQHHQAVIIRVNEIKPHLNADNLELIFPLGGYQVVVRKGEFKIGELAVYVQPDSVVPQTEPFKFIWENYLVEGGTVPEKRRRITVRKFRKEWSEGLLMPIRDLPECYPFDESDDVSDLLGIYHYEPPEEPIVKGRNERGPTGPQRWPKSFKGWIYWILYKLGINLNGDVQGWDRESGPRFPYYDVNALKNYTNAFEENEEIIVTEKVHGSNFRAVYENGKFYVGSRTLWKSPESNCIWRKTVKENPWIEKWCKEHEGYAIYGECTPTQGSFKYGSDNPQLFVFDILTPDGKWMDYTDVTQLITFDKDMFFHWVPVLYRGPFNLEKIKEFVDGPSTVIGANHVKEGIVIGPVRERIVHNLGRLKLKIVSNLFYERDNK